MQPKIVDLLDIEEYHKGFELSKSGLDLIDRSPYHYYARHLEVDRPPEKKRAGQLEGNLAHCAILEPDQFGARYGVTPEGAPRRPTERQINAKNPSIATLDAIDWWRKWEADNSGKQIIPADQYDVAMRQQASVQRIPDAVEALSQGMPERSVYWTDERTKVRCRARPDWMHPVGDDGVILVDVKTYSDSSPQEFARQAARKRYHVQDAFYSDGYEAASGRSVLAFLFLTVEMEYPYAASLTELDRGSIELGRLQYQRNLDTYDECLKSGKWPGHDNGVQLITLPRWAFTQEEGKT